MESLALPCQVGQGRLLAKDSDWKERKFLEISRNVTTSKEESGEEQSGSKVLRMLRFAADCEVSRRKKMVLVHCSGDLTPNSSPAPLSSVVGESCSSIFLFF